MHYDFDAYGSIQRMRELAQEDPRNALGFLHDAIKHSHSSDAIRILADAYDRVYCELFPVPVCTEEMVRDQNNSWLEARSNA